MAYTSKILGYEKKIRFATHIYNLMEHLFMSYSVLKGRVWNTRTDFLHVTGEAIEDHTHRFYVKEWHPRSQDRVHEAFVQWNGAFVKTICSCQELHSHEHRCNEKKDDITAGEYM